MSIWGLLIEYQGQYNAYEGMKVSRVAMWRSSPKKKQSKKKKKLSTMVNNRKNMVCDEPHLVPNEKM
jgi:hypothetical protein